MGIAVTLFCKRLKDSKTQMQSQDFSIKFLTEVLMGRRDMVYIACPYYIGIRNYDYKPHILCEGISGEEATRFPFDDVKSRKEYMMEQLEEMMEQAQKPAEKEALRRCMDALKRA
jgi:hypothetical protein